jgi:hypothetical protein
VSYSSTSEYENLPWSVEATIDRFFRNQEPRLAVVGTSSLSVLGALLSLHKVRWSERPHLVVVPTMADASRLECALSFFEPSSQAFVLPAFDVGVYSGLYPNRRIVAQRLSWLWRAGHAKAGDILIAPIEALAQKTIPYSVFQQSCFSCTKNEPLPEKLSEHLQRLVPFSVCSKPVSYFMHHDREEENNNIKNSFESLHIYRHSTMTKCPCLTFLDSM